MPATQPAPAKQGKKTGPHCKLWHPRQSQTAYQWPPHTSLRLLSEIPGFGFYILRTNKLKVKIRNSSAAVQEGKRKRPRLESPRGQPGAPRWLSRSKHLPPKLDNPSSISSDPIWWKERTGFSKVVF